MYTRHFNLTQRPFSRVPAASRCVMYPGIQSCFERARDGIQECAGPVLVIGPSGCGKSMLLALLEQHFHQRLTTVTLNCATIDTRHELIQCLLFEMGLPFQSDCVGELRLKLIDHLKSPEQCPNGLLLLVDEGHNLPLEVLEELRMITNMVCGSRHQIRLVVAGGRALEEKLGHPQLESFSQRIGVRCYLQGMSRTETMYFALAQLQTCGRDGREIFQPSALEKVFDITDGVPRMVAHLCDHTLKMAARQGDEKINSRQVQAAWLDLQQLPAMPEIEDFQASGPESSVIEFGSLDDSVEPALETLESDELELVVEVEYSELCDGDQEVIEQVIQHEITRFPLPDTCETSTPTESVHDAVEITMANSPDGNDRLELINPSGISDEQPVEATLDSLLHQLNVINLDAQNNPDVESKEEPVDLPLNEEPRQETPSEADVSEPITTSDLFGTSFEDEQVIDIQSAMLADQNRISSVMTSAELADLKPVEAETPPSAEQPTPAPPEETSAIAGPEDNLSETFVGDLPAPFVTEHPDSTVESTDSFGSQEDVIHAANAEQQFEAAPQAHDPLQPPMESDETLESEPVSAEQLSAEDDSDMLILDQLPEPAARPEPVNESRPKPSQGQVIRMNYQDLFQQLRNQSPNRSS